MGWAWDGDGMGMGWRRDGEIMALEWAVGRNGFCHVPEPWHKRPGRNEYLGRGGDGGTKFC